MIAQQIDTTIIQNFVVGVDTSHKINQIIHGEPFSTVVLIECYMYMYCTQFAFDSHVGGHCI